MNRQQRTVVLLAIAFVVATGVYAPWLFVAHIPRVGQLTRFAGFSWMFRPPAVTDLTGRFWASHDFVDVELDWGILAVEWGLTVLVTVGLVAFFHGSRRERIISPAASAFVSAALRRLREWLRIPAGRKVVRPSGQSPRPAPHWALDILADPNGDLDWVMEQSERIIANPAHFPVGPWQILFDFDSNEPDIPSWFPREHEGRVLSFQERLIWFDQTLQTFGQFPEEWPRYAHALVRQLFVVDALVEAYEAWAKGRLPEPDFINQKAWEAVPPREQYRR